MQSRFWNLLNVIPWLVGLDSWYESSFHFLIFFQSIDLRGGCIFVAVFKLLFSSFFNCFPFSTLLFFFFLFSRHSNTNVNLLMTGSSLYKLFNIRWAVQIQIYLLLCEQFCLEFLVYGWLSIQTGRWWANCGKEKKLKVFKNLLQEGVETIRRKGIIVEQYG